MIREVITAPLRVGVCAASLGLRVAGLAAALGLRAAERVLEAAGPGPQQQPAAADQGDVSGSVRVDVVIATPPSIHETPSATPPAPTVEVAAAARAEAAQPEVGVAPETAPAHVSEGLELVESFADTGAQDGVGAVVHVSEPWKGYGHMTANEIIARLAGASREELAAVELYEHAHRSRRTVLSAADRHLRRASAGAPRQQRSVSR